MTENQTSCTRKRYRCWTLPAGLLLGLLATGILYHTLPMGYEAKALIQVRAVQPQLISDYSNQPQENYRHFVNTQIVYMRSPVVLDKVLKDPAVAHLPVISQQRDKRNWLARKLRITHEGNSGILMVSIITNDANASEMIVNAVVKSYFESIEDIDRQFTGSILSSLQAEKQRYLVEGMRLQESVRAKTAESAHPVPTEYVWKALSEAEINLTAMQAKRKAIAERMEQPHKIPEALLMQLHPELTVLEEQKRALQKQRKVLEQTLTHQEDDPRLLQIDQQIEMAEEQFKTIALDTEGDGTRTMPNLWRAMEEVNLFQLDLEIRVQEILVVELTKVYNERLQRNRETGTITIDLTFDQSQLDRVDAILAQIADRLMAISSEQRAPSRITILTEAVSSIPRMKPKMVLGIGIVMCLFFPVLLGVVLRW